MMLFIREHLPETAFSPFALDKARLPLQSAHRQRHMQAGDRPQILPRALSTVPLIFVAWRLAYMMTVLPTTFLLSWAISALHNSPISPTSLPLPTRLAPELLCGYKRLKSPFSFPRSQQSRNTSLGRLSYLLCYLLFKPNLLTPFPTCTCPAPAESWLGIVRMPTRKGHLAEPGGLFALNLCMIQQSYWVGRRSG